LKESISRVEKEEEQLKERLKKDYKGTVDKIEQEIDKILITQNLQPNKKNVEYKRLVRRWIDLKLIGQNWKRDLLTDSGKTDEDLQVIFHHRNYLPYIFENQFHKKVIYPYYWVPILGCLTGCRLEELCMMRCSSIIKVNGV